MDNKNTVFKELLIGILLYGIVVELVGVWFAEAKVSYTLGLWAGVLLGGLMAWHMQYSLHNAFDSDENGVRSRVIKGYVLRTVVVLITIGVFYYFKIGNIIAVFVGIMGLKVGAYLQPLIHHLLIRDGEK